MLADAAGEHVEVVLDFSARSLLLEGFVRNADGRLVDAASVGVDPTAVSFAAASFDELDLLIASEGPCTFDAEPDIECSGTAVGIRPNGSVVVTGGVAGWVPRADDVRRRRLHRARRRAVPAHARAHVHPPGLAGSAPG